MGRFVLVRNPSFGYFWVARLVSYLGSAVTIAALVLYVYESEGSGVAVGLLLLAETLPRLLGPLAGTLADRAEGGRFMILCDLGQAVPYRVRGPVAAPFPRACRAGGWRVGARGVVSEPRSFWRSS